MNFKDNFLCFLAMIFWSVGFPAGEILLETWGTLSLVFIRTFLGVALLLCIWIIFDGYKEVLSSKWYKGIFIGGIGFGFGATFLLYGQKISDPVTPAIAVAMTPVSGMLVEIIFDKRKMNFQIILGILIVLFGGLLASGIIFFPKSLNFGFFYCYLATLFFGWGTQATSKSLPKMSTIGRTTITLIGSVLCMGVLCLGSLFFDKELITIGNYDKYSLFLLFLFSVFSLAIAQSLWIWGSKKLGVMFASLHMNAVPFYVMVIMYILFHNSWDSIQAYGALIVAFGVFFSQTKFFESKSI